MADVNGLLSDPRFQGLDTATQKATLGRVDSRFANLSDDDFNSFKQRIGGQQGGPGSRQGQPPNAQLQSPPPVPYGLQQGRSLSETLRNEPVASPGYIGTTGVPFRAPVTQKDIGVGTDDRDSVLQGAITAADPANPLMTRLGGARQAAAPLTAAAAMLGGSAIAGRATAPRPFNAAQPFPPAAGVSVPKAAAGPGPLPGIVRTAATPIPGGRTAVDIINSARADQAAVTPPSTPIQRPTGSTAIQGQINRSLPPRAIPPGGPQAGTVRGTIEQSPGAPQMGSTAIPGQYGRSMPAQFPPKQPPVGSLPLNPPQAPPVAQGAPPVNPPAPPQGQPTPPVESAPQGTPSGPYGSGKFASDIEVQPWMKDAATAGKVKADAMHPILADRLQSGTVTADQLASDPGWNNNPAGANWKQLAKDAGVNPRFSPRDDNTPSVILKRLGITRKPQAQAAAAGSPPTMPQPVQQQQAGPAAARMSPPNILRAVANAVPKEGIGIAELRESLPQLSKPELDQAVMDLYRSNKIDLDAHDFPQGETPENLARLTVPDGKGNYFIMAGRK